MNSKKKRWIVIISGIIVLAAGEMTMETLGELSKEKGSRKIRMMRDVSGDQIRREIPDLSSP